MVGPLAATPVRSRSPAAYSANVRSLLSATSSSSSSSAVAPRRGAGPPACGFASRRPSIRHVRCQRWTVLSPTRNRAAIEARLSPPRSHASNTRSRNSAV